jgi:hypothetical protein
VSQATASNLNATVVGTGTLAVQVDGAALTALQLIDNLPNTIGSTTSGQSGALGLGAVTTAAPTYTTAQTHPLSLQTDGALRVAGAVSCSNCTGSGASHTDDALFTVASGAVAPAGFLFDDAGPDSVNEGDVGVGRMSANRVPYATIRDAAGNERGVNVTAGNALVVDGSASTQPVSGTVTVGTFPDNEPFNVSQINGVTVLMGAGNTGTGSQRVTEATDSQLSAGVGATGDAAATAGSTGSVTAKLRLMTSQLDAMSTTLTSIAADQTGASVHYRTSAGATEDEHEIKGTAGRLFSVTVTNTNAAARYLRCYNLTAANTTPGTSTVFFGLAIPGATTGAGFTTNFGPAGIAFGTALTCAFTTGAADTDVAEVAANEIKAVYAYK